MSYAEVRNSAVVKEISVLPPSARRLDTAEWIMGLETAPISLVNACGFYQVVNVAQPVDTSVRWIRSLVFSNGVVTETWTSRAKTQQETDKDLVDSTRLDIIDKLRVGLARSRAYVSNPTPNGAETVAQVKLLSRLLNGLTRVTLDAIDPTATSDYTG